MKLSDVFKVKYARPLDALKSVSIAELAQFTDFTPHNYPFSAAWEALRKEWKFEYISSDNEYQTISGLKMFFKDGSSIELQLK